jgi:hypothetical protein
LQPRGFSIDERPSQREQLLPLLHGQVRQERHQRGARCVGCNNCATIRASPAFLKSLSFTVLFVSASGLKARGSPTELLARTEPAAVVSRGERRMVVGESALRPSHRSRARRPPSFLSRSHHTFIGGTYLPSTVHLGTIVLIYLGILVAEALLLAWHFWRDGVWERNRK